MDDLKERLKRAYGAGRGPGRDSARGLEAVAGSKAKSLREQLQRIEAMASRQREARAESSMIGSRLRLEEMLDGREVATPLGACYEVKAVYRETYRHGHHCIGAFRDVDAKGLNLFCAGVDGAGGGAEDFLFLDLEATGLSLGTGTYGFLIGLGYFRDSQFHIHQVLLRNFDEEPAFLFHARRLMEPFRYFVTFNGKAFDLPLLETRFAMWSQVDGLAGKVSWDLLYAARRLWSDRLEDCRLGTIERERLRVVRQGPDIPGEQIPGVYLRYVHEGDARDLDRVLYHNAMDVLTMTSLAIQIDLALKEKNPFQSNLFSVGRYYERKGIRATGSEFFEAASARAASFEEKDRALFHLAALRRREGRHAEAAGIWREIIEREGHGFADCCVELAKHLEHRAGEYEEAIGLVLRALERVGPEEVRLRAEIEKRLQRLKRKRGSA